MEEAREVQISVSKSLQSCEEMLYEDPDDIGDEVERCLFTPEVTGIDTQLEKVNAISKAKVIEVKEAGATVESVDRLRDLFAKYVDIFRVESDKLQRWSMVL